MTTHYVALFALMFVLFACGEIREVPTDRVSGNEGSDAESGTAGTDGEESSGGNTTGGSDETDETDETGVSDSESGSGSESDGTGEPAAERIGLCHGPGDVRTVLDGVLTLEITVDGMQGARDVRVGVRGERADAFPLTLTVEHEGVTATLIDVPTCTALFDFFVFDGAAEDAEGACLVPTDLDAAELAPTEAIAPLLEGDVDGIWRVSLELIDESADELVAACITFPAPV